MGMTIEEAKTKWCPAARTVEVADDQLYGPFNRYHTGAEVAENIVLTENRCLADGCMAWIWIGSGKKIGRFGMAK